MLDKDWFLLVNDVNESCKRSTSRPWSMPAGEDSLSIEKVITNHWEQRFGILTWSLAKWRFMTDPIITFFVAGVWLEIKRLYSFGWRIRRSGGSSKKDELEVGVVSEGVIDEEILDVRNLDECSVFLTLSRLSLFYAYLIVSCIIFSSFSILSTQ